VLDPSFVERRAEDLATSPGLVEKDWHVIRVLGVSAKVHPAGMIPAFSGGTSLFERLGADQALFRRLFAGR
jgi:hypothetical protein